MLSTTPTGGGGGGGAKKLYKINFDYTHSTILSSSPKTKPDRQTMK